MKRHLSIICLGALALSGLMFVSCDKSDGDKIVQAAVPALTVTSSVSLGSDGGKYSFTYSLTNPADDGQISCIPDVSWITNLEEAASGVVTFNVAANTGDELRTGNVTVTYNYTEDGVAKYILDRVGVIQSGLGEPSLAVQPNEVTADYAGGSYSFSYSIDNAASDGELTCTSSESWVSGFDYSSYGTVAFTVAASSEETLRTATITAKYTYSGTVLTKEVTVVQDHPGDGTTPGGGDVSDVIGTYTARGFAYGHGYTTLTETEWTVKIYAYTGYTGNYDIYIDGLLPAMSGSYDQYRSYQWCAYAYYADGVITVPSQTPGGGLSTSTAKYYLGYTPCVEYDDDGSVYYSQEYPPLTFTYDSSAGQWVSDLGEFMVGCTSQDITTMAAYFQYVIPTYTLTKTSSTTSLSAETGVLAHPVTEPMQAYFNFRAE